MSALLSRITVDPTICHGQPTVRGLRYPVQNVLELLASGMTEADILADYEDLEADDLRACQAYAAEVLKAHSSLATANRSMNGKTGEEWKSSRISGPLSKKEFLIYLRKISKLPQGNE